MEQEVMELLRRGVQAVESLAKEPEINVPAFPAVCPHCEEMNPSVRVEESAATGHLAEFVIQCHCLHCNNVFYALPMQFICVQTTEEAKKANEERAELNAYNS